MMTITKSLKLDEIMYTITTSNGAKVSILPSIAFISTESLSRFHLESACLMSDWKRAADLINLDGINNRISR